MDQNPEPTPQDQADPATNASAEPQSAPVSPPSSQQPTSDVIDLSRAIVPESQSGVVRQVITASQDLSNDTKKSKKAPKAILLVLAVIIVTGGAVLAFVHFKPSGPALVCTPPSNSDANKSDAVEVYGTFAQAIKQKNQTCVDSLSTSYFKQFNMEVFGTPKWITESKGGLASVSSRLADIPDSFNASSFAESDYTRAIDVSDQSSSNATSSTQPTGVTLSYNITDAYSKQKLNMDISFISENGKVLVDYFVLVPPALENSNSN